MKDEYFEIKIPKISFKNIHTNTYLIIALIISSFALGYLTNRVIYLENTIKATPSPSQDNTKTIEPTQRPTPPAKVNVTDGHLPFLGNPNAKVTVVEFSDFQCTFCDQFENDTYPQIYDEYIKTNKIKFVFRHYPLVSIHPTAQKAAEASECANEQGKFWEYHKLLFTNQSIWSPLLLDDALNSFTDYATQLGLDAKTFRSCIDSDKFAQNIQEDITDGNKAYIDGTPTFFINGTRLVGAQPFSQIKQIIDQELNK
jgi:protein-disulfide isomerase